MNLGRRWLGDVPQQVGRGRRSQKGGAIAQDGDELGQMLQLQAIVERVPEAMGPMKEGQGDENEQVEAGHRMRQEAVEELVAGCLERTVYFVEVGAV